MLDVHPPHEATHSWKDFFIHIATIVIGLLIAIGLEQTVEAIHHHREVKETREALRVEMEDNQHAFLNQAKYWRWETVELQNNLEVLAALRQHPGTPAERLPGIFRSDHLEAYSSHAAWATAQAAGVISLLPRAEVDEREQYYATLENIDTEDRAAWLAINDASRFMFRNPQLSSLTPTQIEQITTFTQVAMEHHFMLGILLRDASSQHPGEFPPSISREELLQMHRRPTAAQYATNPAYALTMQRLEAAGYPHSGPTAPNPASHPPMK